MQYSTNLLQVRLLQCVKYRAALEGNLEPRANAEFSSQGTDWGQKI